jgi:predicted kinase
MENDVHVIRDLSLYDFAANKINHIVKHDYLTNEEFYDTKTLFIEFSRGGEVSYAKTLDIFDEEVLKRSAIFYVKTPFDECWRRNVARYEEKRKFSVLEHMVPREQMERLYQNDDWGELTSDKSEGFVTINGVKVPFVTMDNEIELKEPEAFGERYKEALDKLIVNYKRPPSNKKRRLQLEQNHFKNLFVFGRPSGGKSEFIEYMKLCPDVKRLNKFHTAPFEVVDDFLFLCEVGENEDIFDKYHVPRRVTEVTDDGIVVTDGVFFHFVSEKINRLLSRKILSNKHYYDDKSLLIECSRSTEPYGYSRSLSGLKEEILNNGAIIYFKVSYEEALKRNDARYQEKLKHSVLAHKVPEKAMEAYYRDDDWMLLTSGKDNGYIDIEGTNIPFVTLENEPESMDSLVMEKRYLKALDSLHELWLKK